MLKIKVTTNFPEWPLARQTTKGTAQWGNCKFFINESIDECDYWVIYRDLVQKEETIVPQRNTIFITGEPESVKKFNNKFLQQFGVIFTSQKDLKHSNVINQQEALPWMVGWRKDNDKIVSFSKDYDELKSIQTLKKDRLLSVITSNKAITMGHRKRYDFVMRLKELFGDKLDVFGRGIHDLEDKWDAIASYKYHIVLENSSYDDYWTEKLSDAYLGNAYPFYYGCTNIQKYFGEDSLTLIDINNAVESHKIIMNSIESNVYEKSLNSLLHAKEMILDKYNFFAVIHDYVNEIKGYPLEKVKVKLSPEIYFKNNLKSIIKRNLLLKSN